MGPRYSRRKTVHQAICGPRSLTMIWDWSRRPREERVMLVEFGMTLPSLPFVMRSWWTE